MSGVYRFRTLRSCVGSFAMRTRPKSAGAGSSDRWVGAGGLMKRPSKVRGQWICLYRAVDGQGNTVEFCLSRTRDIAAAKAFASAQALKHHLEPPSITLDGRGPSHSDPRPRLMAGPTRQPLTDCPPAFHERYPPSTSGSWTLAVRNRSIWSSRLLSASPAKNAPSSYLPSASMAVSSST